MAKKKGGVGRHVTEWVAPFCSQPARTPDLVPELKKFVRVRVTRALKTINKNGAYRSLKKAAPI